MDAHRPILLVCFVISFCLLEGKKLEEDGQCEAFKPHVVISRHSRADGHEETWGYIEVRKGARLFWWLHKTTHTDGYKKRPLVFWTQGGPGVSAAGFGNLDLVGPIDSNLKPRNTTWLPFASLLFVDSPVGTGYSYVDNDDLLTTDIQQATADLITFSKVFFSEQPDLKTAPYYIFAQSYGGKFAVEYAWALQQAINNGELSCNLKGYALGNCFIDPVEVTLGWAPQLLEMSLVDQSGFEAIQEAAIQYQNAVLAGQWDKTLGLWAATQQVIKNKTNGVDMYNILNYMIDKDSKYAHLLDHPEEPIGGSVTTNEHKLMEVMNGPIKKKVGIVPDDLEWSWFTPKVFHAQENDLMKDVMDTVDLTLMNSSMSVTVYIGQLDLICNAKSAMKWVQKLKWSGIKDFNKATRHPLVDPLTGQTELYVKANGNFKFYWVLRSGHAVPKVGNAALRLVNRIFDDTDR